MTTKTQIPLTLVALLINCEFAHGATPSTSPFDDLLVDVPGFGVRFTIPEGWRRLPESRYSQLARIGRVVNAKCEGLIEIDTAPAKGQTPAEAAKTLSEGRDFKLGSEKPGPGGSRLVSVAYPSTTEFASLHSIVLIHKTQLFSIDIAATDPHDAKIAEEAILGSLKFSEPKPAVDDLSLRKRPIALFNSPVLISLPEPFRPDHVKNEDKEMFLGVRDWTSGRDEASLLIQLIPNPQHAPLSSVADSARRTLPDKLKLDKPLEITKLKASPETYLSAPFAMVANESQRIAYIMLDNSSFAVLIFRTTAPDKADRDRYDKMSEQVVRLTRISTAYDEGRKAAATRAP